MLVSCKPKTELIFNEEMLSAVPDSLIQPTEMIPILLDIQLAESAAGQLKTDTVKADDLLKKYYPSIFHHHNVTQQNFINSYSYYQEHPLLLNYIYQHMVEKMNLIEQGGVNANDTVQLKN